MHVCATYVRTCVQDHQENLVYRALGKFKMWASICITDITRRSKHSEIEYGSVFSSFSKKKLLNECLSDCCCIRMNVSLVMFSGEASFPFPHLCVCVYVQ